MSKAKLNEAGFLRLPDWHDAVCRYLRVLNNKKHVLVTGGTGNIGRYVVKKLLDSGYSVTVATTHPEAVGDGVGVCTEPIFSGAQDIYERVGKPDVCIHMAWHDGFVHNSPAHMASLSDHITFCKNMMEGGLPVLSCMGTMHEVGYWEGAIDENTPCNPQTQYGIAKNAMRQSLLIASKNTGCTLHWLRLFYIVTNDKKGSNIFSKIMRAAQEGQARFPFTSGKNLYDFMKIDELVRSIVFVSVQTEVSGVTNVCTGKPESLASCVERFIKEQQLDICLDYGKFPDRTYDSPGVWGDASKINSIMSRVSDKCSVVGKKEC
jgi:dTDP-6-deoxy-L-talose 4-dehydrogenase (NAD+)